ncbi:hypothetical protein CPT_Mater97 [Bacillus phage Mater]|uniref:Uncharacterized protein n=1 Tax=Bacillus phage Mater TaxID=1540090 RepID=A0A0A0RNN6_9CAUD|nr:hypothetical protein CPT_Mater97 [Bacillus phage Mater]AIW03254.1 hypothetical protein CPT_Mater97 [Bacillus phage Mater]
MERLKDALLGAGIIVIVIATMAAIAWAGSYLFDLAADAEVLPLVFLSLPILAIFLNNLITVKEKSEKGDKVMKKVVIRSIKHIIFMVIVAAVGLLGVHLVIVAYGAFALLGAIITAFVVLFVIVGVALYCAMGFLGDKL